jgi:hypothetical protein
MIQQQIPVDVIDLLPFLDRKLIELLKSLSPEEWEKQTIASLWKVKDVAAHLLDGNIRTLSMLRDNYQVEQAPVHAHQEMLDFLNGLNADWIRAMKRVSPTMLILLHEATGQPYYNYYKSLNPYDKSGFAVDWAGESTSQNWMHIAREYTEKFLHQQQIREAVNKPGLMVPAFFYPFIDVFMLALPYTYRNVKAEEGTIVKVTVTSNIGGAWFLIRINDQWQLNKRMIATPTAEVIIEPEAAWKLFSKSVTPDQVEDKITILGDRELAEVALTMVSVMA